MKTTLFERWRRKSTRLNRRSHQQTRTLRAEALEQRMLLTATSFGGYSRHDVNQDGYFNVLDVINLVSYVNTHGSSPTTGTAQTFGIGASGLTSGLNSASSSAALSNASMDVNNDGFVNVLDIIAEVKAFDAAATSVQVGLVATDAAHNPLSGPILVGTQFYLDVQVQDLRTVTFAGVAGANLDIAYSGTGSVNNMSVIPTADYPSPTGASHGDTSTPGLISNVQGSENLSGLSFAPLGNGVFVLDRIQMTAATAGTITFQTQINGAGEFIVVASSSGSQNGTDPDAVPVNQITLGSASITIVDAPPVPATLAGNVFVDANGNNSFDSGSENGVQSVTVQLLNASNAVVSSTTTDASGNFSFTNITPGTYSIHEVAPGNPSYVETVALGGTSGGTAQGRDTVASINLAAGATATGYSFGLQQKGSIGGSVYVDANGNNMFDGGDSGQSNVTINLTGQDVLGNAVSLSTQTAGGGYSFSNLTPGTYQIAEVPPGAPFVATAANVGSGAGGAAQGTTAISSIALGSAGTGTSYNFGLQQSAVLSGSVYLDANTNNTFDSGDSGVPGVTIQLTDASNATVSVITDAAGNYTFTNITPGVYKIHEVAPGAPYNETVANVGTGAGGSQQGVDTIVNVTFASGGSGSAYNFGVQNTTPALVKYGLVLTDVNHVPLAGPVTAGQVFYVDVTVQDLRSVAYAGVASGNVDVAYVTQGGGSAATPTGNVFANTQFYPVPTGASHGDALGTPGLVKNVQGTENLSSSGSTFYFQPLGTTVFVLAQFEMTAGTPGVVLFSTQFSTGEQTVLASNSGLLDINDSLVVPSTQIAPGFLSVTIVPAPATISGTVYVDGNNDNLLNGGDTGKAGVTVQLIDSTNAVVGTATTNASGNYSFNNVTPGTYSVHELQPAGVYETAANAGMINGVTVGSAQGIDTIANIAIASGNAATGYNFAVQNPSTLSGAVYFDANANGTFDAGDTGIAGVTVQLTNASNVVVSTTTIVGGTYSFTNFAPGVYQVHEQVPAGSFATAANVGLVGANSSGTALNESTIQNIGLNSGLAGTAYNFGVQHLASIAGSVYLDANGNNSFDGGDSGISGVTVQLLNSLGQIVGSPILTDASGNYSFTNLMPGTYSLHELPKSGLFETATNLGTGAGGTQSGVDTFTNLVLSAGTTAVNYRFAMQDHLPAQAQVRLAATDLAGNALPSVIPGGTKIWVYEYVTDLRQPLANATGVLAAYTNVIFDPAIFQVVSPLTFGADFQNGTMPSSGIPSNLHDVGAFSTLAGGTVPGGNSEYLVFKVQLQVVGAGLSSINPTQPDPVVGASLGVIMVPPPGQTDSGPLPDAAINFVGLTNLQTTAPSVISVDPSVTVTNSTTAGALKPMLFTVHVSTPMSTPITLYYTTQISAGDNAVPGTDFVQPNYDGSHPNVGRIVIPANATSATIQIDAIGNALNQADKRFHLVLSTADNNGVISATANTSLGTIKSGVAIPSVSATSATGVEGGFAVFNVTLSAASGQVVTVHYATQATSPVSAVPGVDFQVLSGDLVFYPGDPLTQAIVVQLPLDPALTSPRQFLFTLSLPSNATVATPSAVGTINPVPLGSLSGYVYYDANNNGNRDGAETGYSGVTVNLTGVDIFGRSIHMTTTTNAAGYYYFGSLAEGQYTIKEVQPALFLQGKNKIGTQGGDASVIDQFMISLGAGVAGVENDFGEGSLDPNMFWWPYF